jgi:hypothetical protein
MMASGALFIFTSDRKDRTRRLSIDLSPTLFLYAVFPSTQSCSCSSPQSLMHARACTMAWDSLIVPSKMPPGASEKLRPHQLWLDPPSAQMPFASMARPLAPAFASFTFPVQYVPTVPWFDLPSSAPPLLFSSSPLLLFSSSPLLFSVTSSSFLTILSHFRPHKRRISCQLTFLNRKICI